MKVNATEARVKGRVNIRDTKISPQRRIAALYFADGRLIARAHLYIRGAGVEEVYDAPTRAREYRGGGE